MKLFCSTNGAFESNDERVEVQDGRFHGFSECIPTAPSNSDNDTISVRFSFEFQYEYTSQFSLCTMRTGPVACG